MASLLPPAPERPGAASFQLIDFPGATFMRKSLNPRACPLLVFFVGLRWMLLAVPAASAQAPSQMPPNVTSPVMVPLSGLGQGQQNVVTVTQMTSTGGSSGVDVSNSSVDVRGPIMGSVPNGKSNSNATSLTLADALKMGLRFNLAAVGETNQTLQAQGQRRVAKSGLMPTFNTALSEEFEQLNLRTEGVETDAFPLSARFNYFDGRAIRLDQTVLDLVKLDNLHSASASVTASLKQALNARDLIVLAVGGAYLQLIATKAREVAAEAQVASSEAIYKQAADRFAAGLNARIDANRAQVQLQTEQQRLRSLRADFDTQKLRLARLIGLPLGQVFEPADAYGFAPVTEYTVETALGIAMQNRTDLQAAGAGVKAAEEGLKAAKAERLPTLRISADVGAAGLTPSHQSSGVFSVAGTLNVPLYEGGRIKGDEEQAQAALRQRKAEFDDLRGQVDEDVRQAFIDLDSAADQVVVAQSNEDLAHETLRQSTDRFTSGVADTVELVQAEQAVVQADNDWINAVFEHNLAKAALARAMGNAERTLPQLLRK